MASECIRMLTSAGIAYSDAVDLRRIAMTLHRWHELECGDGNDWAAILPNLQTAKRQNIKLEAQLSEGHQGRTQ